MIISAVPTNHWCKVKKYIEIVDTTVQTFVSVIKRPLMRENFSRSVDRREIHPMVELSSRDSELVWILTNQFVCDAQPAKMTCKKAVYFQNCFKSKTAHCW